MSKILWNMAIIVILFVFSVIENKTDEIHFNNIIIQLKNWFNVALLLPFLLINKKQFFSWLKQSAFAICDIRKLLFPFAIFIITLLLVGIRIKNHFYYMSDDELFLLAFTNRMLLTLYLFATASMIISHLEKWEAIGCLVSQAFGKYKLPDWVNALGGKVLFALKNKKRVMLGVLLSYSLLGVGGYFLVTYKPKITKIKDASQSSTSTPTLAHQEVKKIREVNVYYTTPSSPDFELVNNEVKSTIKTLDISFSENPYELEKRPKPSELFEIFPDVDGKWKEVSDTFFEFHPENHWDTDTEYKVVIKEDFFRKNIELNKLEKEFSLKPVALQINRKKFYVNPKDSSEKKAVYEVSANYPLDKKSLKNNVTIYLKNAQNEIVRSLDHDIFKDKLGTTFYIHSK